MGYSPQGCKELDTTKQLTLGAAENCMVQPTQDTEGEGTQGLGRDPLYAWCIHIASCLCPRQHQHLAQHTQGPQTMLWFIEHARLVRSMPLAPFVILKTPHCSHL